jgi:hypothetical protein
MRGMATWPVATPLVPSLSPVWLKPYAENWSLSRSGGQRDQGRFADHEGEVVEKFRGGFHRLARVRSPCGRAPATAMRPRE